ncbi:MAG: DEAD/DEAH box helicase [Archaeoglobi archaeon]|nr:DEAD/DEAH box helicase [Candidatus Mnemosynella bozhongmuii]
MSYYNHPLLKRDVIEYREYQVNIAKKASRRSLLVVLPTGLGKTVIALIVMLERLLERGGKVLMLAPTKPLVEQHYEFIKSVTILHPRSIAMITGNLSKEKRAEIWRRASVIVATPQTIENDLITESISLKDVSCIVFDEAHRAVGEYSYVYIARRYREDNPDGLVLGITASPGSSKEKIEEICRNLGVEGIEVRTEYDEDVLPYVYPVEFEWIHVEVPVEIRGLKEELEKVIEERIKKLREMGVKIKGDSKKEILEIQERVRELIRESPSRELYEIASIQAEILKLKHAVELLETQGVEALKKYLQRLRKEASSKGGSKASKRLFSDERVLKIVEKLENLEIQHPKLNKLLEVLQDALESGSRRIIVFANFRDSVEMITSFLKERGIKAEKFIGQGSRNGERGLTQREQSEIIRSFRDGEINVLVATSVAEEGIDIPATDLVVFYEPVPSEIRSIQRRGRTGRDTFGRVVMLITKDTRDEVYYWISRRKEKIMKRIMRRRMIKEERKVEEEQKSLEDFRKNSEMKIIVDHRELRSGVVKELKEMGLEIEVDSLEVGDYQISQRVCVERKTAEDFVASMIDPERNLFKQIEELSRNYEKPVVIVEGENLFRVRNVHPHSIMGALASISIDFRVPILFTRDSRETAEMIFIMARRELESGMKNLRVHAKKTSKSDDEILEYIVSSFPGVGLSTARALLEHFGSIRNIVNADEKELQRIKGVGKMTAEMIKKYSEMKYGGGRKVLKVLESFNQTE